MNDRYLKLGIIIAIASIPPLRLLGSIFAGLEVFKQYKKEVNQ